jgi:hypothetical protein
VTAWKRADVKRGEEEDEASDEFKILNIKGGFYTIAFIHPSMICEKRAVLK